MPICSCFTFFSLRRVPLVKWGGHKSFKHSGKMMYSAPGFMPSLRPSMGTARSTVNNVKQKCRGNRTLFFYQLFARAGLHQLRQHLASSSCNYNAQKDIHFQVWFKGKLFIILQSYWWIFTRKYSNLFKCSDGVWITTVRFHPKLYVDHGILPISIYY